ncbi:hypothetical protein Tco_0621650 [Tanacetum coccineum]
MANLPNNNEFALAVEVAPDNMNGWVEEEDLEMEEEEDPEEDPEMEEEEMDADEQWDGLEWILPYQGADPLYLRHLHPTLRTKLKLHPYHLLFLLILYLRLFPSTESSSSAAAAGHNPEDLTPSHIRSDLDALHRRVQHIEEEDVRADNKRLKMMLDCSENRTRDAWREHDRATWHYHHLRRWSIMVENLLPPRLRYQEPPYALPETLLALSLLMT